MYFRTFKLYKTLHLHNNLFAMLIRPVLTPVLFCAGFVVVFDVYTILRVPQAPFVVSVVILYTCVVVLHSIYFHSEFAVAIIQASEDVIRNLGSREHQIFRAMPVDVRKMHLARMRSLRPLQFPVGHFATFSFHVTKVMFDQILSHLVFVLSL